MKKISEIIPRKAKHSFYLTWYEKEGDRYIGEVFLEIDNKDIEREYKIENYIGGVLPVTEKEIPWLNSKIQGLQILKDKYDYFIEVWQEN
jgi:hypothetical protein